MECIFYNWIEGKRRNIRLRSFDCIVDLLLGEIFVKATFGGNEYVIGVAAGSIILYCFKVTFMCDGNNVIGES
jgi:uncharacterized membrane protein YcaP (DUF421 family)